MKKSKFIFITLLIAFFSLCFVNFGSNKQVAYAAELTEEEVAQSEADKALSNLPDDAIISFPVTSIVAEGYDIVWEVTSDYARYDSYSHWVEIERSTEEERSFTLTVKILKGEVVLGTSSKEITIPAGFTAAPVYKIDYKLNDGVNHKDNPSTYKLGARTFELNNPTKEGYTFKGWYDNAEFKGEKIEAIHVGSRSDLTLYAKWEEKAISNIEIKEQPSELEYNALETFNPAGLVITVYYDNGTVEDVEYNEETFQVSKSELTGNDNGQTVTITYEGYELETNALTVNKLDYVMENVKWSHSSPYTYDGKEQEVVLTGLPEGVTVSYEGNKAAVVGSYVAKVVSYTYDEVNYNAPEAVSNLEWSIVAATLDMSNVKWNYSQAFTYEGTVKEVLVTGLPEGVTANYTTGTNSATNAGNYQAKVAFEFDDKNYDLVYGENEFNATLDWSINKVKVYYTATPKASFAVGQTPEWDYTYVSGLVEGETTSLINLENVTKTYWQGEQQVQITQLAAGAEFTAKFTGATALNYEVVINDYTGSISTVTIYFLAAQTYTYNTQAQTFVAKAYYNDNGSPVEITDGTISYSYEEAATAVETNAGTYKVTVTLSGSQYGSQTSTVDFVIEKAKISMASAAWNYTSAYTYDPEVTRTVSLTLPNLVTATYENNSKKDADKYTAVATLDYDKDNYELIEMPQGLAYDKDNGTISLAWEIKKAQIDMKDVAWDYTDALIYKPEGHTVVVKGLPENVTVSYEGNTATEVGTYTAKATFTPAANYELINNNLGQLDWEITQATHDMSQVAWVYTGPYTYENKEFKVSVTGLPEGVEANYGESVVSATKANTYTATVAFDYDSKNYKLDFGQNEFEETLVWEIKKAQIEMKDVAWDYTSFTYDTVEKSVKLTGLVASLISATYSGDLTGTNAGDYKTVATLVYDKDNYVLVNMPQGLVYDETEGTITLEWNIARATYSFEVEWNYQSAYTYDGSYKTVAVQNYPAGLTPNYVGTISAKDVDKYEVKVTFTNTDPNYNDTDIEDTLTWEIVAKGLANADVVITVLGNDINQQNPDSQKPEFTIVEKTTQVTISSFESVTYTNNEDVTEGTITIVLNGNYSGTLTVTFAISESGQANLDAEKLQAEYENPTELPRTVGQSKVEWTNLPTALQFDKETGALTYVKPIGEDVEYKVLALVTYGTTSAEVVDVTITITGLHRQESNGIITEGEDSDLSVSVEDNADYVITVDGVEQETLAAYDINFAGHDGESEVTVKILVPEAGKGKILQVWHITDVETGAKELVYTSEEAENGEYIEFTATSFSPYVITVAPTMFEVSVNIPENGTAALNKTSVAAGKSVTLTVDPSDGYKVSSITVNGDELELVENQYEYVIENIQEATTIVVEFELEEQVNPEPTPDPEQPEVKQYVKVTSAPADWSGTYLIVYETASLAFNGGLKTLDAGKNTIAVTINNQTILVSEETKTAQFVIEKVEGGYVIKSASGYYIGQTSNDNGLKSNKTTKYVNTITLNGEDVDIVSGAAYLRYNATSGDNNLRFRYYKSSSYTNQKAIQLYKLVESSSEGDSNETHTCVFADATCTLPKTCSCGKTEGEPLGHTEVIDNVKNPTCTTTGLTEGSHCSVCGEIILGQQEIPATGHNFVSGVCSVCGTSKPTEGTETTVTVSIKDYASANNWTNGTKYTTLNMDESITVTAKGTDSNTGKYYTSGYEWRTYQTGNPDIVIKGEEGFTIKTVKITYNISNTGVMTLNGSAVKSETTVDVNANSITFKVGNSGNATNGQVKITAIEVVYTTSSN